MSTASNSESWSTRRPEAAADGQHPNWCRWTWAITQNLISGNVIDIKYRSDGDLTSADIQTDSANEQCCGSDAAMGETIQIGRMTWVVRSRSIPLWKEEDEQDQVVELEATDRFGANGITVVSINQITADTLVETFRPGEGANDNHVSLTATPLSKQARTSLTDPRV